MATYEHRIKCTQCGLHYIVLSDDEEWTKKAGEHGGYCPECGARGGKLLHAPFVSDEFIFQKVPGEQLLVEITAVQAGHQVQISEMIRFRQMNEDAE